jgi:hypothetical protein
MAEKLSVQIALEGGDEIARQLGDIGKAGTKAFTDIGRAAEKVGGFAQLDPTEVTTRLTKMGITGVDAINKIQTAVQQAGRLEQVVSGVKKLEDGFDKLGISVDKFANKMAGSLGPLGVFARALGPLGIGLAVAGAAFLKFGDDSAKALATLNTEGAKLGLTAQEFDKLQKAFGKIGVAPDALASSLEKLKPLLGGGLFRLGDIAPPDVFAGLQQFIAQLERMPDSVARTQLAMATLGDALGGQVIAGLQTGANSAQIFAAALASVTPATQEQIAQAARYQQSLNQLGDAWTRFKAEVAAPVGAPVLDFLTAQLPGIQAGIATTVREFQALWSVIDTIASGGAAVIGALAAPIQLVITEVQRLASTFAGWNWNPIAAGVQVWNDITAAIGRAIDALLKFIGLKPSGGTPAPAAAGGGQFAGGGLLGGRGTGTSDSNLAWLSRGEYVMPASAVRQPGVLSFLEALRRGGGIPGFADGGVVGGANFASIFNQVIDTLKNAVQSLRQTQSTMNNAMAGIVQSIDRLARPFNEAMDKVAQQIVLAADTLQKLNQATGKARGGLLGGRGSGTSDSNLAWVSRGEHIMPARAVAQPGVLAFLEALRRSGGNLSRVLDGMGRFALGGMVPRMPAFAGGGSVGSMSHVTIAFPGLPEIGGLRASSDVVDQLQRAAALAQVRSGGRKPSRYS